MQCSDLCWVEGAQLHLFFVLLQSFQVFPPCYTNQSQPIAAKPKPPCNTKKNILPSWLLASVLHLLLPLIAHLSCGPLPSTSMRWLPSIWCGSMILVLWTLDHDIVSRWRPYRVECTGSLSTSEVKRRRARLVLGWGTAWEDLRVLSAFAYFKSHNQLQVTNSSSPPTQTLKCLKHSVFPRVQPLKLIKTTSAKLTKTRPIYAG